MRIAYVTPNYFPFVGGVEKLVQKISEELAAKGHEVEIITTGRDDATKTLNGVSIRSFPRSFPFYISYSLTDYLIRHGHHYDIVQAHNFHTLIPLQSAYARKKAAKKFPLVLMSHYHGKGSSRYSSLLLKSGRRLFSANYRSADVILCHTEFESDLLKSHFALPKSKIRIIPGGVDIAGIEKTKPYDDAGKNLCVVSRLEKYKNIHLAIKAMYFLPEEYHLVIIGDGPYKPQLQRITGQLGLVRKVTFKNFVPLMELYSWLKTCALVLNLSDLESFGLTVIEGLAAGKPVVVNNRTALAELAKRFDGVTAVDAAQLNPRELARAIQRRAETPLAEKPCLGQYTWKAVAEQLLGYYQSI
ncbi:glycosyltransferase family 4 protein [Pelotomaculum propionicicum]|uniref:glycosyltransferase family 4 protein n=1 Tax=Pelotomaculum propionicicum TaxID=258475 RepID=UPI003B76FDE0